MNEIFIFAELTPKMEIAKVVFELSGVAQKLKQKLDDAKISAVVINKEYDYSNIINTLSKNGFDKIYLIKNNIYEKYSTLLYTKAYCELIKEKTPKIALFGATRTGRDLAPRISSRLALGLTADCTDLDINDKGQLAVTRPTFGGNLMATILSKTMPQMATIRPNVFPPCENNYNNQIEVEEKFYDIEQDAYNRAQIIDFTPFADENISPLTEAKIIVSGGMGMKSKEGFELLGEFAKLIGAQVGASRAAVEAGLADAHLQIGQTGKTVMPDIYIACGISGAIQHMVGINMAKKIIAINKDKNAPIFKNADVCIEADVFEILPQMIKDIKGDK